MFKYVYSKAWLLGFQEVAWLQYPIKAYLGSILPGY